MNDQLHNVITKPARPSIRWQASEGPAPRRLEVNVIFTDPQATAVALKTAGSLAQDLGACIRVRAAIAVPYPLPLDKPQVSIGFIEGLLSSMVSRLHLDTFEPTVDVYLGRDQVETLSHVLSPNSVAVIGGRKHWWPTAERRVAGALRTKGHRVVLVGLKSGPKEDVH